MTRTKNQHLSQLSQTMQQIALLRYSLDIVEYTNEDVDHFLPLPPNKESFFVTETYCMDQFQRDIQYFSDKHIEATENGHHQRATHLRKMIKRAKTWLVLPGVRESIEYFILHNPDFRALCEKDQFYETLLREKQAETEEVGHV